jgi:hypothetical protein
LVKAPLAGCSGLILNVEIVARTAGGYKVTVAHCFKEGLLHEQRERNLLRVGPCHRLRAVQAAVADDWEEVLARRAVRPKRPVCSGVRTNSRSAAADARPVAGKRAADAAMTGEGQRIPDA